MAGVKTGHLREYERRMQGQMPCVNIGFLCKLMNVESRSFPYQVHRGELMQTLYVDEHMPTAAVKLAVHLCSGDWCRCLCIGVAGWFFCVCFSHVLLLGAERGREITVVNHDEHTGEKQMQQQLMLNRGQQVPSFKLLWKKPHVLARFFVCLLLFF